MNLDNSDQWDRCTNPTAALIYYAIHSGYQVKHALERARENDLKEARYYALVEAIDCWRLWYDRTTDWLASGGATDKRWCAAGSLLHNAGGLFAQVEDRITQLHEGSISTSDYEALSESLRWWDIGLRRFIRRIESDD